MALALYHFPSEVFNFIRRTTARAKRPKNGPKLGGEERIDNNQNPDHWLLSVLADEKRLTYLDNHPSYCY